MRILITGASGFVGNRLVKELSKKQKVIALCHSRTKIPRADTIVCDLLNKRSLNKIKDKKFEVVYHLAAELDESSPNLWDVNVEGTRNLLEICKDKKLERFIFLSPIGVLGETKHPANEDDPYNPITDYEKSKAEAERIVMDYRLKYQIPYTIIRSTIIYGPNEFWKEIFQAAKEKYPIIGSGENFFHLIYIDDVIQALVLALQPQAKNQIYHIAGPDPHTYLDTYKIIAKHLHTELPERHIPITLAKTIALAYETGKILKREKPKLTMMRSSIERLVRNRIVSIEKAKKELGFDPKFDLDIGIEKTIKELSF